MSVPIYYFYTTLSILLFLYCSLYTTSFNGTDGISDAIVLDVVVKVCDCSGNGQCDYDNPVEPHLRKDMFQVASCDCLPGWTGEI